MTRLSIITPAYNEAENLPVLYEHLREALKGTRIEWEWIVVDDHSTDDCYVVISHVRSPQPVALETAVGASCWSFGGTGSGSGLSLA